MSHSTMSEEQENLSEAPRQRNRVPSGPRLASWRSSTASSDQERSSSSHVNLRSQKSLASIGSKMRGLTRSPEHIYEGIEAEYGYTTSPDSSPDLQHEFNHPEAGPSHQTLPTQKRGKTLLSTPIRTQSEDQLRNRSRTTPISRTASPSKGGGLDSPFHGPSTPTRSKPKPLRLQTADLGGVRSASPTKATSPSLKHWHQIRQHVLAEATTVAEDQVAAKTNRKFALMSKAVNRFGFRQGTETPESFINRRSTSTLDAVGGLSAEEREHIAHKRRQFGRDIKICLDACAAEETKRRLSRAGKGDVEPSIHRGTRSGTLTGNRHMAGSVHGSMYTTQAYAFDPNFSAYAPLLMELHRHLPDARAKKPWSRTCPHHGAILSELGVAFIPDSLSTDGERQQALEVYGMMVRNWAPDDPGEELERWLWLLKALLIPDKQLRDRGFSLLSECLNDDKARSGPKTRPTSASAFVALGAALLELSYAVPPSDYGDAGHTQQVESYIDDLLDGRMVTLDQSTLIDLLPMDAELSGQGQTGGVERELLWISAVSAVGDDARTSRWLLANNTEMLQRFKPDFLLHATPPSILQLRAHASRLFLQGLRKVLNTGVVAATQIWDIAQDHVIPDLDVLPHADDLVASYATLLLAMETSHIQAQQSFEPADRHDPFRSLGDVYLKAPKTPHRQYLVDLIVRKERLSALRSGVREAIIHTDIHTATTMVKTFLALKDLLPLGQISCSMLLEQVTSDAKAGGTGEITREFMASLQKKYPQILYKSLFSLSAATSVINVRQHLSTVHRLATCLGRLRFWTEADPQMVVIVLMGKAAPSTKAKGKSVEEGHVNVKLGRFACLLHLTETLSTLPSDLGKSTRKQLQAFCSALESRIGLLLEEEQKSRIFPVRYQTMLCDLLYHCRIITASVRKSTWQKLTLEWFLLCENDMIEDIGLDFEEIYRNVITNAEMFIDSTRLTPPPPVSNASRQSTLLTSPAMPSPVAQSAVLRRSSLRLLVALHSCLSPSDWLRVMPILWRAYGGESEDIQPISFLLTKCGETVPGRFQEMIIHEFTKSSNVLTTETEQALYKVSTLFGWRYGILAQVILTDRRGPIFQFPLKNQGFVVTEIGSAHWIPPPEVQDAALKKFGTALPLELRQRLLELGWNEDDDKSRKTEWDRIPISLLPSLQFQTSGSSRDASDSMVNSPMKSLLRKGSTSSNGSIHGKRRKTVFSPVMASIFAQQAILLYKAVDSRLGSISSELIGLLQRDDPSSLVRTLTDEIPIDFPKALASLNVLATDCTPTFARAAFNAVVGYLKHVLRSENHYEHWASALATATRLVPHVSGFSLRDVRKNKAEHVLLPASIHEEETGFKVHQPWTDGSVTIQTAQLVMLRTMLEAGPRDVYLVKKMLSNLQLQSSISHLPFSRAWLQLATTMFTVLNRNYNDRAELRYFLSNIVAILRHHGTTDCIITSHSMGVLMLCSARFRRLFASVGFNTVMRTIYETYEAGRTTAPLRDCIEYAMKSFYRIHQESFVYQACTSILEGPYQGEAVYQLLSCLSDVTNKFSGVASGLRGINETEELEALIHILSGPELSTVGIGQGAPERAKSKLSQIDVDGRVFPRENIVRLLITVIAANPGSARAINFLRLLRNITAYIEDVSSKALLEQGVEALGINILKGKTGSEATISTFHLNADDKVDWTTARKEYIMLVEAFASNGGKMGPSATRRTLDMVVELLRDHPESLGSTASSILHSLAKTRLNASDNRPIAFLKDIAPLFRSFITIVDFSGVLDEITALISRSGYALDAGVTNIIFSSYLGPAVGLLASASEDHMAMILPLRKSTVKLLCTSIFLSEDAFVAVEKHQPNANFLASLLYPICLELQEPQDVDREQFLRLTWIRLLNYVIQPFRSLSQKLFARWTTKDTAAYVIISTQIIKTVVCRAPEAITGIAGLWTYLAQHFIRLIPGDMGKSDTQLSDWLAWTLFRLVLATRTPFRIELRHQIQLALGAMDKHHVGIADRSPSTGSPSHHLPADMRHQHGRQASAQTLFPQSHHRQVASSSSLVPHETHSRSVSEGTPQHNRKPSAQLSPFLAQRLSSNKHQRMASSTTTASYRSSTPDRSRGSSPVLPFALPSDQSPSAQIRTADKSTAREKGTPGLHLLGTPNKRQSGEMVNPRSSAVSAEDRLLDALSLPLQSSRLVQEVKSAMRACLTSSESGVVENDLSIGKRSWSSQEAVDVIIEQTRIFMDEEIPDIFDPTKDDWVEVAANKSLDEGTAMSEKVSNQAYSTLPTFEISTT